MDPSGLHGQPLGDSALTQLAQWFFQRKKLAQQDNDILAVFPDTKYLHLNFLAEHFLRSCARSQTPLHFNDGAFESYAITVASAAPDVDS